MSQEYELTLGLREITNAIWMDGHGDSRFPGYDFVIRLSGELIEKFPKVGELYAHRGYAIYQNSFNHYPELSEHYFKSNLEEAMSDINEAIRLSPRKKSSDLYYKKALIYKSQKKYPVVNQESEFLLPGDPKRRTSSNWSIFQYPR